MLANLLAIIIGLGSLGFYLAAFILPEVHRRSDFFWSGVGLFYAVVLWYCARQMQGAVLLGQAASVGLVLWLGYQTLVLRRENTPAAQQTPIQLGKTERNRSVSRPIIDYEFVEDGVEDAVEQAEDPDDPILIQPTGDGFSPKIVVPAAIPLAKVEGEIPEKISATETVSPPKTTTPTTTKKKEKPSPIAAVGIIVGWLKDVVSPKQKPAQPMIELPSRPPSIPKANSTSETTELREKSSTSLKDNGSPELTTDTSNTSSVLPVEESPADLGSDSDVVIGVNPGSPPATAQPQKDNDEEDSNWPDDEF